MRFSRFRARPVAMSILREKRLLQISVLFAACVPVLAGLAGVVTGPGFLGMAGDVSADSHFRYLSGLLLAIGLGYWSYVPSIETKTKRFKLLTLIVVMGGMARLISLVSVGVPSKPMLFGLVMELMVAPIMCLWQNRVARLYAANTAMQ
jgi:hypothetical protein